MYNMYVYQIFQNFSDDTNSFELASTSKIYFILYTYTYAYIYQCSGCGALGLNPILKKKKRERQR